MSRNELEHLKADQAATVLWCGQAFAPGRLETRRDFPRLEDALRFIVSELPLGRRLTVWTISSDRLIPPEGNAELCAALAA